MNGLGEAGGILETDDDRSPAADFQYIHDLCVVRAPEAPFRAVVGSGCGELAVAFGEYCFQVPANRIGYGHFTGFQLKIIQESIMIVVFIAFAYFYLGEAIRWNYVASFVCLLAAVGFGFWK